ncbi:tagaturonate reductase [Paenibacillaceae bacterium WGS1546]|uniref:tagaturonate reductase n=1 Tax=Cohnella sp. WGS1546 TaxID=3366810 RepID=UPI00372D7C76
MNKLNRSMLQADKRTVAPASVLQIGEGNFLRGFVDWMIHECREQGLYEGAIAVTQPRPSGKPKIDALNEQDRLYTLVVRGLEGGERVERKITVTAFAEAFDPYSDWERFIRTGVSPALRVVVSNTTEAGLVYRQETLKEGEPILSFPGKIAYLLYRRYVACEGAADRGLVFLPCELLERNGDALRDAVLRYAEDWGLPEPFKEWVRAHNRFLNSLVDRIVTGYPEREQAEAWFAEWGYRDDLLCVAEPYHLWAIEAESELEALLPFRQAGLNVHWVDDLKPYQQRKVRILNGAHTLMAPLGIVRGFEHVRGLMEDAEMGEFVRSAVIGEIVPSLPYDRDEMKAYADTVFERYANPFIRHRLADIAMNSVSKFGTRLLPSLEYYAERGEPVPGGLAEGLAGLLRYYRVVRSGERFVGKTLAGDEYEVRDDARVLDTMASIWENAEQAPLRSTVVRLLAERSLWGRDLSVWPGLAEEIERRLAQWLGNGGME